MAAAGGGQHHRSVHWRPQHREHPERWFASDPRWLGQTDATEWSDLFGDRPWLDRPPSFSPSQLPTAAAYPGLVTTDLVYDADEPSYEGWPPCAYLAVAHRMPERRLGGRTRPAVVAAGTRVEIYGTCAFKTSRPADEEIYVWMLPGGQVLYSWPPRLGGEGLLADDLVPAVVAPAWSTLATVEAGSALVARAFELASAEWDRAERRYGCVSDGDLAIGSRWPAER